MTKKNKSNDIAVAATVAVLAGAIFSVQAITIAVHERKVRKQIKENLSSDLADIEYAKNMVVTKIEKGDYSKNFDIDDLMTDFEFFKITHHLEK